MQSKKTEICNARTRKTQHTQPMLSLRPLHFSCACIAFFGSASHNQHALRPFRCVWQLGKRPFVALHTVSKLYYATHATHRMHGLPRNQKSEIHNTCTQKKQCTQLILFSACIAFFVCMHCRFIYLCRMTSVLCISCVAYSSLETDF